MRRVLMPLLALAAICVLASFCASTASAGILIPQQITFDADDLEQALNAASSSTGASSAPVRRHVPAWPREDSNEPNSPLELARSLPTGSSSSTTTSPSPGGAIGSGIVVCLINNTLTLRDDSPLGTLAEDHGLFLPDPPGLDLLRPPRVM